MLITIKNFIRKELFQPTYLSLFINPFYHARKALYINIKSLSDNISGRVLDVGCGNKPYRSLFNCEEYVGLEIDTPKNRQNQIADLFYDGNRFPAKDRSFDNIICNEVFEHVFAPDEFLSEIARVLKPNGNLLLTVPFFWDEHEQPVDFARYSSFGLKYLLEKHGFKIIQQCKTLTDIRVLFQILIVYLYKVTATKNPLFNTVICIFLISPFNILGQLVWWFLPRNNDLYLDNVILARRDNELL